VAHDTPSSELPGAPDGGGVGSTVHVFPSKCSASIPYVTVVEKSASPPTAVQDVGEAHDTAPRLLSVSPFGVAGVCVVQVVPFHVSARGAWSSALTPAYPTAVHAEDEVQDTPGTRGGNGTHGWRGPPRYEDRCAAGCPLRLDSCMSIQLRSHHRDHSVNPPCWPDESESHDGPHVSI
jgi:hypothetical protein